MKKCPTFKATRNVLPCSENPCIGQYLEPVYFSLHLQTSFFRKYFNNILWFTRKFTKNSLSSRCVNKNSVRVFHLPCAWSMSTLHPSWFNNPDTIRSLQLPRFSCDFLSNWFQCFVVNNAFSSGSGLIFVFLYNAYETQKFIWSRIVNRRVSIVTLGPFSSNHCLENWGRYSRARDLEYLVSL